MEADVSRIESSLAPELYFLIAKFLSSGPCQEAAAALRTDLERAKILPQRIDWEGNYHDQTFEELEKKYPHIGGQHLLQLCARMGPVLEKEVPPCVPGAISLLGAGKQSLLRTKEDMMRYTRTVPMYSARFSGKPILDPPGYFPTHNIVKVLQGRENSGPLSRHQAMPSSVYKKLQLYRHTLGHLSAVYCVLYDRTGKYIITGADDLLVKVWSSLDGRLLATFRGASAEIMDIAVNFDNTLLAAGSLDRILRVWCFQTMSPVAVLSGHSGMITSVKFCPIACNGVNYLVSTSSDGSVAFWPHSRKDGKRFVFEPKPIQYHEKIRPGQSQMICASFSPGGAFMAAGSADHHVRVYIMLGEEGPRRVLEIEAHSDTVDSIQWAHSGLKFISGSKDGTANVWHFEQQQWHSKRLLMTTKLPNDPEPEDEVSKKPKVTMVCWDVSDNWVVTAVNDSSLKIWNAKTGELVKVLRGHKDEVFVLEAHPIDPRVVVSAGHDGQLIIWDVLNSDPMACFQNFIQGQGNGAVFDAKWSPDGSMLAATDSHGHLMMYGFGSVLDRFKSVPKELFFHTDYRPLIRDSNNYVLDEQTQTAPHLMPPPFLVDVDGNPYPPKLQQLVPGRENCRGNQLVPNIAVGVSGNQEVIEGIPDQRARSNIDRLIEALAQRNHINGVEGDQNDEANQGEYPFRQIASPRGSRAGLRRVGDVEGVRQSSGNWQRDNTTPWNKPILARPLNSAVMNTQYTQITAMADAELEYWRREMRRRPAASSTTTTPDQNSRLMTRNRRNRTARHGYRTRATRGDEPEDEDFDQSQENEGTTGTSASSLDSSNDAELGSDSSSSDDSSEYSDWIADHGLNLEPPKRSKRKPVRKRVATPPSSDDTERRRSQRPKKKKPPEVPPDNTIDEVPEIYRPSEWLTEVIPRKAPYYPQMGDEIVYFRQGHQFYLNAVKQKKTYELHPRCEPWSRMNITAQEFVKVVGIKYEIRPPRLCCLKLAQMDEEGRLTGATFKIKYHDMADVLDFLVLRQTFETALARSWSEGDRFRCMIDDCWWTGQIQSMEPLDDELPESFFMCFRVRWDNGEFERMSPWDLEPIDSERLPSEVGGAVNVLPEEIQAILYQPQAEEWPMGDREATCRRINRGLDQVMSLSIAEPFVAPVDLNLYPSYAFVVEYPIDLSTIKARFENHFYRRITSAQFDVRYLATNAEKFNEPHSQIVKQARIVTDLCLKIIKETIDFDVPTLYHQLVDTYQSSDSDVDVVDPRDRPSTSAQKPTKAASSKSGNRNVSQNWQLSCRQLLESLWQCEDSIPFREPVNRLEHPNYFHIIDTPMDLRTVKEDLLGGNYATPSEFAKDVKLIFTNSRNYNTNKRSKIYSMTIRLSAMFDEYMRTILSSWKSAQRRKNNQRKKGGKKKPEKRKTRSQLTNGAGPSKSKMSSSDEDEEEVNGELDDDDEDDDRSVDEPASKRPARNIDAPGPSRLTNGHSKRLSNSSRSNLRLRNSRTSTRSKTQSFSDSEESVDSDASIESTPKRRTRSSKVSSADEASSSADSYKPRTRGKQTAKNRAKNSKNCKGVSKGKAKKQDTEDEDEEEEDFNCPASTEPEPEPEESEEEVIQRPTTRGRMAAMTKRSDTLVSDDEDEEEEEEEEEEEKEADEEEEQVIEEGEVNMDEEDSDEETVPPNLDPSNTVGTDSEEEDGEEQESNNIYEASSSSQRRTRGSAYRDSDSQDGVQSSRRNAKRPRYNEESEDSDGEPLRIRRSVKKRYYAEESDESIPESATAEPGVSISSRGRVRKMTARARAFFIESP